MADLQESIKIDGRSRKVDKRLSSQEVLSMGVTDTASASASVTDGGRVTFTITTSHDENLRVFATEHTTVYETSVSAANKIPVGDNIGADDYEVAFWQDWGSTDNKNVKFIVFVYNRTGSTQTILIRSNARFIVEAASST